MRINHMDYCPVAQYSIVYGKSLDDSEFKKLLSTIGCKKAVAIISKFISLHLAVSQGDASAVCFSKVLRILHAGEIGKRGGDWVKYNRFRAVACLQSLFILEKWVLAYCDVEQEISAIQLHEWIIMMDALLAVNDRLPGEEVVGHETEYLYLTAYYNSSKVIKHQIARAFHIYATLLNQDPSLSPFVCSYKEARGFSIEERLSCLFNLLGNTFPNYTVQEMSTVGLATKIDDFDAKGLSSVYKAVIDSLRIDYSAAKKEALSRITQVWDFECFYRYPFLRIDDLQFPFSQTTIVYQMWEGLYWDVRFAFHRDGEKFMTQFGRPFEHYIQEITKASVGASQPLVLFQDEFHYNYKKEDKASSDCYFRIGNTLFAIEAKAKSPHSKTLTGVDRTSIETEVVELMINPVMQVIARLNEINSGACEIDEDTLSFFAGVENTIILVVSMEKVQPVGELLSLFDQGVNADTQGSNIIAYHNVNIEEYEAICNLIEICPLELQRIMTNWFTDQRKDPRSIVILANFLCDDEKPFSCPTYVSSLFDDSMDTIYKRTFNKERPKNLPTSM